MQAPVFREMVRHGAAERGASGDGLLVLSKLPRGASEIRARPPSVKFVLAGEEVYSVRGRTRRLRAGEFLLMDEGADFVVRTSGADATIGMCVYLAGPDGAGEALRERLEIAPPLLGGGARDPLSRLLGGYARRFAASPDGAPLPAAAIREISIGAFDFLARLDEAGERLGAVKASTRLEILQRVRRAHDFLHDHADRPVTLDELAAAAALSKFHLARSFREVFGAAPLAFHRELRISRAADALRTGVATPTELAAELGYKSPSSFTRAFHRRFGVPPSRLQ